MPKRLILLTGGFDAEILVRHFRQANPHIPVTWVRTLDDLMLAADRGPPARLISFCNGVIVPQSLLARMDGPSYNVHPGPPTFPGRYPECWGAYLGARRFGATLHVMLPRVDEGEIIDTRWVDMPPDAGQRLYSREGFRAATRLLIDWSMPLATIDGGFPANGERWEGRKWRLADIHELALIGDDVDEAEFERRRRAFAEIPGCSLRIERHGRVFTYIVPADETPAG
ncbi:MAG TPA: hypothetical protein VL574_06260 [Stellaceae bacterium]|jgi:methionyl-tRNA formyltransferase|nr:hypothetical protein [Stellaceae bacterium]